MTAFFLVLLFLMMVQHGTEIASLKKEIKTLKRTMRSK